MKKLSSIIFILLFSINCSSSDDNKIDLNYPELLLSLSPESYVYYFYGRTVDLSKTSSCGTATPYRGTTAGTTGTTGVATTTGTSGSSTSNFTIVSQLILNTGETLAIRYILNVNQTQGSVDAQQGFTVTGGLTNNTISGKIGTVEYGYINSTIGYIDESNTGSQTLSFFDIDVTLSGTFQEGTSSANTVPNTCYTLDNVNCTTQVTSSQCFTDDNKTCRSITSSGTVVTVKGTINCTSNNIIYGN
ncbi:MAG: hypothetical protein KDK36_05250 [Leptospiraceae bacterium]|nr:hypothetical protein [Leptospiraceae bacterium]